MQRIGIVAVATALCAARVLAAPLSAYGALPGIEDVAIAPSGDRVAIVGVVDAERTLALIDRDNQPLMAAPVGENKVRDVAFADDTHLLVSISNTVGLSDDFAPGQKIEQRHVIVVDTERKSSFEVFKDKVNSFGGVLGSFGTALVDGRPSGFFSTIKVGKALAIDAAIEDFAPDLFRVDLQSAKVALVSAAESTRRDWVVGSDGTLVAQLDTNPHSGNWVLRSPASGRELARGNDGLDRIDLISQGTRPGTAVLQTLDAQQTDIYTEFDMATGAATPIMAAGEVDRVILDPATRLLVGYMRDGDVPEAVFFDKRRQARMRGTIKAFPGERVRFVGADSAFDSLIVLTDGPDNSGTYWRVDIPTGKAVDIGYRYAAIKGADVAPVAMIDYVAADGLALHGVLTLPRGRAAGKLPLVVLPHGGPAARDHAEFDWWAQALASRGYAVFQPNFRGSTGYGPAFQIAGNGQWGTKMQTDISDGVAALAARGIIDPKRACIMGASYGGYAALAGVTLQQGLYRCAVSVAGVADLQLMKADELGVGPTRVQARNWATLIGARTDLAAISPAMAAARADAPVLLIHGRDDTVVPYAQSTRMAGQLRAAGKPVELVTLKGEDHWLSRGATREAMLVAAVAFIEKHNPPGN
jgi:dipeptidyl aminopeptidase/acylaminoacyl peptidase